MTAADLQGLILDAIKAANEAREPEQQIAVSPDAVIFGRESPLDSLGLVALIIDIEEALAARGVMVTLTNERAMSRSRNPFRSVSSLAGYIAGLLDEQGPVA